MEAHVIINPAGKDKVANFLMSIKGKKLLLTMVIALGIAIVPVLFTLYDGTFINQKLMADAINDYANISLYIIGLPLAIFIIAQYSGKFPAVLEQLRQNRVIVMNDGEWNEYKNCANKIFSHKIFCKTPYLVSLIITLYLIVVYHHMFAVLPVWYSVSFSKGFYLAAVVQIPIYILTFYTFSLCILNIIATYVVLRKLFNKYKISVQPLHPDNCGGLSPLGILSKKLNAGIILIGIIAGANIIRNHLLFGGPLFGYFHLIVIISYIGCAYVVFFMPLYAAHESMKNAKYEEIRRINEYFLIVNQKLKNHVDKLENIDQGDMDDFENINKIYDLAKKMPVFPYNIGTVTSFIGSIFIPIFLFILDRILQSLL